MGSAKSNNIAHGPRGTSHKKHFCLPKELGFAELVLVVAIMAQAVKVHGIRERDDQRCRNFWLSNNLQKCTFALLSKAILPVQILK